MFDNRPRSEKYPVQSVVPLRLVPLIFCGLILIFFNCVFSLDLPGPYNWLYYWVPWNRRGLTGGGNFIISDQMDQFMPMLNYTKQMLLSGEIPWWNSELIFGFPFFPLFICGHLFPLSAVSLLAPVEFYWIICASLKFFFLGFFTFKLLKLYNAKTDAALLGGIIAAFSLYSVVWAGDFLSHSYTAVVFFFFAITNFKKRGSSRLNRFLIICSSCFVLLGSFPSVTFYGVFASGLYVLVLYRGRLFNKNFGELLLLGLFSVLLCSIPLFYTGEFLSLIDLGYRERFAGTHLPLKNMIQLISPEAYGNYVQMADNRAGNFNEVTGYFGLIPVLLCFLNLSFLLISSKYRKNRFVLFWTFIQLWSLAMVYNWFGILSLFKGVPVFGGNPSTRMLVLSVFSSSILSAMAFFYMRNKLAKKRGVMVIKAFVLALVMFAGFTAAVHSFASADLLLFPHLWRDAVLFLIGLLLLASYFLPILGVKRSYLALALCALVFYDLYSYGARYNGFYRRSHFYPKTDSIEFLSENLNPGEKIITIGKQFLPQTPLFYGIGSAQSRWFLTESQIERLRDLDPEYRAIHKTSHFFRSIPMDGSAESLKLLNVKYVVADRAHFDEYERDDVKFSLAGHFEDRTTLFENKDRRFLTEAPGENCSDDVYYNFYYKNSTLRLTSYRCTEGQVTLPIWDYPGWSLLTEGVELASDEDLLAVKLPSGRVDVELGFRPRFLSGLLVITLLGLLGSLFLVFRKTS